MLCGSAFKNKGVQPLLDAVVDYLPSPLDIPDVQGVNPDTETADSRPMTTAPFSAWRSRGDERPVRRLLTFIRIYSGTLEGHLPELGEGQEGKVGRMLLMHANAARTSRPSPGDIVALAGLKETTTGDTLCAEKSPIILERMEFPEPVIELSVGTQDQGRPGRWASRSTVSPPKDRVSA